MKFLSLITAFLSAINIFAFGKIVKPIPGTGGTIPQLIVDHMTLYFEPLSISGGTSTGYYKYTTTATTSKRYNFKVYIVNDLYPNGIAIFGANTDSSSKWKTFRYQNTYTRSSNILRIVIANTKFDGTYEKEISLAPGGAYIAHEGSKITTKKGAIKFYDGKWQDDTVETYEFISPDCLMPTYYHELDLSSLKVKCTDSLFLQGACGDVTLTITNRNGVFNDLGGPGEAVEIPLTAIVNTNDITFAFMNVMYVHPLTLLMSATPKEDYVETTHLYFPRNEMKYQGEYNLSIRLNKFGFDKASVLSTHTIKALSNTLGDCYNSEYCILNNNAEVNDIGWAI